MQKPEDSREFQNPEWRWASPIGQGPGKDSLTTYSKSAETFVVLKYVYIYIYMYECTDIHIHLYG